MNDSLEKRTTSCTCCGEGCTCGDCVACSKDGKGCYGGACSSQGCCRMSWWKWLLGILLLCAVFVLGSFHGMREGREGKGWRGGEGCGMMKMMRGGMEGCEMMKDKSWSITTGQVTGMTGTTGTGN